jgi:nitroimidazol reductase NimA-like FMN-containing flavoprotein (pyridoxamine 5'-phosphate oxidase superfamily)
MAGPLSKQEREEFLAEPQVGVVSVASDDGRPPLTVPVWYAYEPGGNLSFFTNTQGLQSRKDRLIEKAGLLSFSVQHGEMPYKYVTVEGTVVGADRPPSREQMLAVARRYLPEDAARGFVEGELSHPAARLVLFTVRPDRWLSFEFG